VAVSASPPDAEFSPAIGWAAVISGDRLQLIEHSMTELRFKPPAVTLPLANAVPVPRFPNRLNAVFLATGSGKQGPALAGVTAPDGEGAPAAWVTPLSAVPLHSACAFTMKGPITVLYSSDDGKTSRLHRIDVNENGTVASADRVVRQSSGEVLGIVADMRPEAPQSFLVVEADRERHDHLALVKIPVAGELRATGLRAIPGWPTVEVKLERLPLRALGLTLETSMDGMLWVAFTNERGDLIGGRIDRTLSVLRDGRTDRAFFPHIGAVAQSVSFSCFNADGSLFHAGGGSQ
jgi:hypothetical protein